MLGFGTNRSPGAGPLVHRRGLNLIVSSYCISEKISEEKGELERIRAMERRKEGRKEARKQGRKQ